MTDGHRGWPRRRFLAGAASSVGVLLAGGCSDTVPPTYGNLLRMGDLLTYRAHRLLLPGQALAREYSPADISSVPAIGMTNPGDPSLPGYNPEYGPAYERHLAEGFDNWRLSVEGLVARPASFSLGDLKRMASRTQITRHACEEGWSAIAQWTGVPLRTVLEQVGMSPRARFVQFHAFDGWGDDLDMVDALHPQTLLAYGMNGRALPVAHGAPVRLRIATQLGWKSMKFLRRIVVSDAFEDHGAGGSLQNGWAWYGGI